MPVRIYEIAKRLGIESKEVLAKAKELGIAAARVPSSHLDKITAEYLEEKLTQAVNERQRLAESKDTASEQSKELSAWTSIADLPPTWSDLGNPAIIEQVKAWQEQADELKSKESYHTFLIRLRRQWAIETGVLERLYSINEGATKTLIERGFDAALISHEDTDKPPEEVLAIIRDQHDAIEGLYQFVSGERPLGTSYVKELHAVLTAHQHTYEAVDTLGRAVNATLKRGEWKSLPNKLGGDGRIEFCPPIHVDSEMERLVQLHEEHQRKGVPPDIEAAWLHHRFTQIHPFADGNGRVARCLATLVFLKDRWFPLVVTRTDREPYIAALRLADAGDLKPLVNLFGSLQGKAIRQAFSLSEETLHGTVAVQTVLAAAKDKFKQLRKEQEALENQVILTADTLQEMTRDRLDEIAAEVTEAIREEGPRFRARVTSATRNDRMAEYHKVPIVQYAKAQHYYANREVYQAWVLLSINTKQQTEILFSFHGVGRATGMLACAAMAYNRIQSEKGLIVGNVAPLATEPFQFTHTEDPAEVSRRFRRWLEDRIVDGLAFWQKGLGI